MFFSLSYSYVIRLLLFCQIFLIAWKIKRRIILCTRGSPYHFFINIPKKSAGSGARFKIFAENMPAPCGTGSFPSIYRLIFYSYVNSFICTRIEQNSITGIPCRRICDFSDNSIHIQIVPKGPVCQKALKNSHFILAHPLHIIYTFR